MRSNGIQAVPITIETPHANALIGLVHFTMGDMLRTKELKLDENFTWHDEVDSMLQSIACAIRSTANTTIKRSPGQLAFKLDMIVQFNIHTNWNQIAAIRRKEVLRNNARENASRSKHEYKIGDLILIIVNAFERRGLCKIGDPITKGPFKITKVNKNGTIYIDREKFEETISIRRVKPFIQETSNNKEERSEKNIDTKMNEGKCN